LLGRLGRAVVLLGEGNVVLLVALLAHGTLLSALMTCPDDGGLAAASRVPDASRSSSVTALS
jgi:hypothetical protein